MEKDIILLKKDFSVNLADLVNNSNLPAFVIADILKDAYIQTSAIADKQEQEAIRTWKEANNGDNKDE